MVEPKRAVDRCPACGQEHPAEAHVCPARQVVLTGPRRRGWPPTWLIVLLLAIIAALAAYAAYLAWQRLVLHHYGGLPGQALPDMLRPTAVEAVMRAGG